MGPEGIEATSRLSRAGVETNVTLIYSVPQALLAAKAGAAWVSPYAGRIDDLGLSGVGLIGDIVDAFAAQGFPQRPSPRVSADPTTSRSSPSGACTA